jgi:Tfp pilus assembly protein PilO
VQIKNRQQLLAVLAVAALALLLGDKLVLSPLGRLWDSRTRRIADLKKQVSEGRLLLQREASIRSRWDEMRRQTLPHQTSAAEQQLYKAIDTWAQESRVSVAAITPQWKHDADDYMTYLCRIEASGNLAALSRFLYDVEQDPMALKLESVELSSHDKEGQQITLGIQMSGLVLNPEAP